MEGFLKQLKEKIYLAKTKESALCIVSLFPQEKNMVDTLVYRYSEYTFFISIGYAIFCVQSTKGIHAH